MLDQTYQNHGLMSIWQVDGQSGSQAVEAVKVFFFLLMAYYSSSGKGSN
jgi:hypothetical protein